jgi:hypothetical protein
MADAQCMRQSVRMRIDCFVNGIVKRIAEKILT